MSISKVASTRNDLVQNVDYNSSSLHLDRDFQRMPGMLCEGVRGGGNKGASGCTGFIRVPNAHSCGGRLDRAASLLLPCVCHIASQQEQGMHH